MSEIATEAPTAPPAQPTARAKPGYRPMLMHFLADESLTKAQRIVGVVLILRTKSGDKFRAGPKSINWEHMAKRTGYAAATAQKAYRDLIGLGWIEERTREDGATVYRVPLARYDAARERHDAYLKGAKP